MFYPARVIVTLYIYTSIYDHLLCLYMN